MTVADPVSVANTCSAPDETLPADPTTGDRRPGPRHLPRGSTIGRYVVLNVLGAGGMGVVYAAYDPDLDRKLAVKLLRPEPEGHSTSSAGTTRLLREAQALAKLTHAHVVAVHDVGTHDGAVFLAMEFVEGETLGDWMAAGPRPYSDVLPRFRAAGRGLAAAHAAGLVHRDFKPDNVLLGSDGRIRVADFGLARADVDDVETGEPPSTSDQAEDVQPSRSGSLAFSTKLTRTGAAMGTPAYMAPEQHLGVDVGPKADQFSFCVALWEALYGERPFAGETMPALAYQTSQGEIREPPPGARVPGWVRRVVLRGLRPEPRDRYPSMDALLADLSRDPAAKRRRVLWTLAAGLVVGGAVAMVWYDDRQRATACSGLGDALAEVWSPDRKRQLEKAFDATGIGYAEDAMERVSQALDAYVPAWTEQAEASCRATQRAEQSERLLDLRMACLHRSRMEMSMLIDVLLEADAATVRQAVDAVAQVRSLERCADTEYLLAASPPPEDPAVAARVQELEDELVRARALYAAGRYKEARAIAYDVAVKADATGYLPLVSRAHLRLALSNTELDDREAARDAARTSFMAGLASGDDETAAQAASMFLWTAAEEGDKDTVEHWASLSEALVQRLGDEELRIDLVSRHASSLRRLGRPHESQVELERILPAAEAIHGADSIQVAALLMNLMGAVWDQGDFARVSELSRRAHEVWRRKLGEDHPRTAHALNNVGLAAFREGRYDEAEAALRRVLEIRARTFGKDSRSYIDALSNLAAVLHASGEVAESVRLNRQLVVQYETLGGPDSKDVGEARANLATVLFSLGALDEAREEVDRAMEILEARWGAEDHRVATALMVRGAIERSQRELEASERDLERALAIQEKALGPDSPRLYVSLVELAYVRLDRGRPEEALALVERAFVLVDGQRIQPSHRGDMCFAHARALWESGTDESRARMRAKEALVAYTQEAANTEEDKLAAVRAWLEAHGQD